MKLVGSLKTVGMVVALLLSASAAQAFPELQLYIEGATYVNNTWVVESAGSLRLWTIADVGAKGSIDNVKLSIAYASGLNPTFAMTGSSTLGYNGFVDPSTPSNPVFGQTVTDGSAPLLGDGSSLPSHGIFGAGTDWAEFDLGDFTLTDSHIADFTNATNPLAPQNNKTGQINVYDFNVSGVAPGTTFHFDLYGNYYNNQGAQYTFAPFSHDAETTTTPEPGTIAMVGLGAAGLAARLRSRRRT